MKSFTNGSWVLNCEVFKKPNYNRVKLYNTELVNWDKTKLTYKRFLHILKIKTKCIYPGYTFIYEDEGLAYLESKDTVGVKIPLSVLIQNILTYCTIIRPSISHRVLTHELSNVNGHLMSTSKFYIECYDALVPYWEEKNNESQEYKQA